MPTQHAILDLRARLAFATALLLCACGDDTSVSPEGSTGEETTGGSATSPSTSSPTTTTPTTTGETDVSTTEPETTTDDTTTSIDTTTGADCGNGAIDPGEDCDGTELGGEDCGSQGFDGGTLACDGDCGFDVTGCSTMTCGNDTIEGKEACDGENLDGQDCTDHDFDDGVLACAKGCADFDLSGCFDYVCGNDVIEGTEACDGTSVGDIDCTDLAYTGGTLGCLDDCSALDESGCTMGPPCVEEDIGSATGASVSSGSTAAEDDDLAQACAAGGAVDRVILWTAPADGLFTFDTEGSDYDTSLAIYADCAGPELACDDDAGSGLLSSLTRQMSAGEMLIISVNGYDSASGNYVLNINPFTGAGDCCAADATAGCDDAACNATVCAMAPYCCAATGVWDANCAALANDDCAACFIPDICGNDVLDGTDEACDGEDVGGASCADLMQPFGTVTCTGDCSELVYDCWDSNCCTDQGDGAPGCDDTTCQMQICADDPYCCNTTWDDICAAAAQEDCQACFIPDICGNDVTEMGEACDGDDVGGASCADLMLDFGTVNCYDDCSGIGYGECYDSSCCTNNGLGAPGCDDATCEMQICADDPYCCNTTWDGVCAAAAIAECGGLCFVPDICGNDVIDVMGEACDGTDTAGEDCVTQGFDGGTIGCAQGCDALDTSGCVVFAGDCCTNNGIGSPGCDDDPCTTAVCGADPYCCETTWDGICATEANGLCTTCGGGAGDCCTETGMGCSDAECVVEICGVGGLDPSCCDTDWSAACTALAQANCTVCM